MSHKEYDVSQSSTTKSLHISLYDDTIDSMMHYFNLPDQEALLKFIRSQGIKLDEEEVLSPT